MLTLTKESLQVVDTWNGFKSCIIDIHQYFDKLEVAGEKLRLAVDTETFICKEARDRYDFIYSCGLLKKKIDKLWAEEALIQLNTSPYPHPNKLLDNAPDAFRFLQEPDYPVPRPVNGKWGFIEGRVRLIQFGLNPQHINLQYVIDLEKIREDLEMPAHWDIMSLYAFLGKQLKPLLDRCACIGQNLKYEYGFFWKLFRFRLKLMRDVYLMSQILWMGDKINHKLSSLYQRYIPEEKFINLINYKVAETEETEFYHTYATDNEEGGEFTKYKIPYLVNRILTCFEWYEKFKEEEQTSPWYIKDLTSNQIKYGAEDVYLIWYVFEELLVCLTAWAAIYGEDILEIVKLECELIKAIAKAEISGFQLDVDYYFNELKPSLQKQIEEAQAECDALYMRVKEKKKTTGRGKNKVIEFYEEKESYNLNSPAQVRTLLGAEICKDLPKTPTGLESTGADELFIIQHRHPVIPLVLKVKGALKTMSFFEGKGGYFKFMDNLGVIKHTVHQIGTADNVVDSGRMAGAKPNLANVPSDPLVRKAFKAKKRKKLIIWDYSQIEPRLQGEDSCDQFLTDCFLSGRDLHAETAKNVFHLDFLPDKSKKEDKPWRDRGKEIRLARTYLMGIDKGLKKVFVESKGKLDYLLRGEEGRQAFMDDLNAFDELTPQLQALRKDIENEVGRLARLKGGLAAFKDGTPFFVGKSMGGRTRRHCLSPQDRINAAEDPEDWDIHKKVKYIKTGRTSTWANRCNSELRDAAREAGNNRFQSSAADLFKKGIVLANENLEKLADEGIIDEYETTLINFVHDEIIAEAEEEQAEVVAKAIYDGMYQAAKDFLKVIPIVIEGGIVGTWADKN